MVEHGELIKVLAFGAVVSGGLLVGCSCSRGDAATGDGGATDGGFVCVAVGDTACDGDTALQCELAGGLIGARRTDCAASGQICVAGQCTTCVPGALGCSGGHAARCSSEGAWVVTQECVLESGSACIGGSCIDLCALALEERSYEGCEFYPVDLDSDALDVRSQSFGVIVSNPSPFQTSVVLEVDDGDVGGASRVREIARVVVPPRDLEVFTLPRRRVDGHLEGGVWIETDSAITRRSYRIRSRHPVVAYQFNPLAGADAFSNDASLLLPSSAHGRRTTVLTLPQTSSTRGELSERSIDDYRAFVTVVGSRVNTEVTIRFGARATRVVGVGAVGSWSGGEVATFTLQPFDVLNLETDAFGADLSGTIVESSEPVAVFTGAEAAYVPLPDPPTSELCCADHLEEQLVPDRSLGTAYWLARFPRRSAAVNDALMDASRAIPDAWEYDVVRVMGVEEGVTRVYTNLAPPFDAFSLAQGEVATLRLDRDTELRADQVVSVVQLMIGQAAAGVPHPYPGGDPAMVAVVPADQYRRDYVFLTPDTYAFDAVTVVAPEGASISLDGAPLPTSCERTLIASVDARERWFAHRCPLSFPEIGSDFSVARGTQGDGVHRLRSDRRVGLVVSGFDRYVSYAYPGGLDLEVLR